MQRREVTKAEFLEELKATLRICYGCKVIEFEGDLHAFVNGQIFIVSVKKFDAKKIPPVE